jgi:hypothetical protein
MSRGIACQENLAKISDAKEQYAMEFRISNGSSITYPDDLLSPPNATAANQGYLKATPVCPSLGTYTPNVIGTDPTCSIGTTILPFEPHVMK